MHVTAAILLTIPSPSRERLDPASVVMALCRIEESRPVSRLFQNLNTVSSASHKSFSKKKEMTKVDSIRERGDIEALVCLLFVPYAISQRYKGGEASATDACKLHG